ncbi:Tryptophan aminotransferase-related protein 3 [Hirschfeldia incana]|nr:Tryptophan aminotransferase-related protein 3 [Hirschfeldia incana]
MHTTNMLLVAASIILNLVLIIHILYNNSTTTTWNLSWTSRAADEAEEAASVSCSGHGRAYIDGLGVLDGSKPPCECNNCYTGDNCSFLLPDCHAAANSGDPLFLEPFWMQAAEGSAVVESGWHRMSYHFHEDGSYVSAELERIIRKLHNLVGNAVTDNRYVIFGTGATQLVAASVHALSQTNSSSLTRLVSAIPYYNAYKEQTDFFNYANLKFEGDASVWKKSEHNDNLTQVIEIVTSPNNPDGKLKRAVLEGPNVKTIHDYAYYWPHFAPITHLADEELSLFSLTKTTGHAGSRFGWALVKDEAVYERMKRYLTLSSMGVSRDTQLRALQLLKVVVGDGGEEIFHFSYETMKKRWEMLNKILAMSTRFSLETIEPDYCNYFKKRRDFTPAYAWVRCERFEDTNCYEIFRGAKIKGREGKVFGSEERFVRLSLIRTQDDFDQLADLLKKLVSKEVVRGQSI